MDDYSPQKTPDPVAVTQELLLVALLAAEVWKSQHRRLYKWRRSLAKRRAWAKRRLGL